MPISVRLAIFSILVTNLLPIRLLAVLAMGEEQFGLGSSLLTAVGDAVMCFYGLVIHGDSLDFLLLPVCFEFCRIEKANTAIARMTRTLHELCAESFFHLHTCLISLRG